MAGGVPPGGDGALVVLCHGVANSGPEIFDGGLRDNLGVDKHVVCRDLGK
ncbi:hypothetical protein SDC9_80206 [bioreactor metagenome]|uniref:Uncharacterized protein n=1 Tax=bioreactor metagenome TaxID=1076179 RepID=A0A644YZA3_9ZZZZ